MQRFTAADNNALFGLLWITLILALVCVGGYFLWIKVIQPGL